MDGIFSIQQDCFTHIIGTLQKNANLQFVPVYSTL